MTGLEFVGNVIEHKVTSLLIISSTHLTAHSTNCSVYRGLVCLRDMYGCYRPSMQSDVMLYYCAVVMIEWNYQ